MSYDIFMNVYHVFESFFFPIFLMPHSSLVSIPSLYSYKSSLWSHGFLFPSKEIHEKYQYLYQKSKNQNFIEISLPPNQCDCNQLTSTNAGEDVWGIPYLLLVGMEISPTTVQITEEKYYK